jgi:MFS family permease
MTSSRESTSAPDMKLFWTCFIALISTSFGFIVRAFSIGEWGKEFGLSATQQGEIFGVGLWPFAISIVLFSLVIDRIGYKKALYFALFCHTLAAVLTFMAKGYWSLWIATFIFALGSGTVEAVINPVVATMFNKDKAKWLNALHAGWPGGLVLAGLLYILLASTSWHLKVALIFIPLAVYGVMMTNLKFPINERVAAGVPYKDMLKEAGALGAFIVSFLMFKEVGRVFELSQAVIWGMIIVATAGYGFYVKSLGRPMFIFLLLVMIPLATTELGTDGWVTALMGPQMSKIGLNAGWIIVYTSAIMVVLRFFAGPIVHKLSPLGLLALCSILAAVGLFSLSKATGIGILAAATLYGVAKSFFWPTMLALTSERFPRGGALTLNTMGGVGMLGVGVVGAVFMGAIQDKSVDKGLAAYDAKNNTAIHSTYVTVDKSSVLGSYKAIDQAKVETASAEDKAAIETATSVSKLDAFKAVAAFPIIMFFSYLALILYFRGKGGYKPVDLESEQRATSPKSPAYSNA